MNRYVIIVAGIVIAFLLALPSLAGGTADYTLTVTPSSAPPQIPTSIAPINVSILNTATPPQQLTALTVGTSDGLAFAGACSLTANPGNFFAISGCIIYVNAALTTAPGTITLGVSATENGTTINQNLVVTVIVVTGGGAACATPLSPATVGPVPAGYNCDANLSDEFSGVSLDTAKWRTDRVGADTSNNCIIYTPVNDTVSGGMLQITASVNTGSPPAGCSGTSFLVGGDVFLATARYPSNYYQEVRWKPSPNNGSNLDPIIFTFGVVASTNDIAEVDDIEFGGVQAVNWFLWAPSFASEIDSRVNICPNSYPTFTDGNFHVFGRSRINGVYTFYYDGHQICTFSDPHPPNFTNSADEPILQNAPELGALPNPASLPATAFFDYIRVYHP